MTEMEALPRLRAKRAANRGVVTKLIEESDEILENDVTLMDMKTRNRLTRIDAMLQEKLQLISELDEKILNACEVDDIIKEVEDSEFFKMRLMDAIANVSTSTTPPVPKISSPQELNKTITASIPPASTSTSSDSPALTASTSTSSDDSHPPLSASTSSTASNPPASSNASIPHASTSPSASGSTSLDSSASYAHPNSTVPTPRPSKSRLPKITLVKFKGDVTQFRSFWDSFESTVHTNTDLTKIDKFNYLVSLLEGSASRAIAGLPITEENYDAAVDIINKRFGKPQQLISAHMDELLKISTLSTDKPHQLRYLYDKLNVNIRGLEALGVKSTQYGSLLIPIIMAKLPPEIRVHVARNTTEDVWDIESILSVIQNEIEAREISEKIKAMATITEPKRPQFPKNPTIGSFVVESTPPLPTPACVYCSEMHFSASCHKITDINDRKTILKRDKRCFTCLRKRHNAEQCDKSCRKCKRKHHQSICPEQTINSPRNTNKPPHYESGEQNARDNENSGITTATTTSENANAKHRVLLQTAKAVATNEDGTRSTVVRLLFDNGSQRSYLTENLRAKLHLKSLQTERLNLNTFGESKYKKQNCDVVNLQIRKSGCDNAINISALTFPVICSPLPVKISVNYPHLDGLELADEPFDSEGSIDMLIGSDYYWDFVTGETRRGDEGPIAVNSKLGWLLSGPVNGTVERSYVTHSNLIIEGHDALFARNEDDALTNTLRNFWETEAIGIKDFPQQERKETFKIDVAWKGNRYEVKLPWKEDCLSPPSDNYQLCASRLRSLHHKLRQDPELLTEYDNIIQDQLANGIIERVPNKDSNNEKNAARNHYLPHHAVVRKDRETTKVRIVYDGSAKSGENSLNDCLETGPNYIPHVFDMLANFRKNAVALTADIEKAFLMVGIQADHRDFLRFLWFENPNCEKPQIVHYKFTRLVFGLRPSPAILGATILHHLQLHKQSDPEIAELLEQSLYVDDLLTGESDDERGLEVYKRCKKIMTEGGFNLRKWRSNSGKLQMQIAKFESSPGSTNAQQELTYVNKEDDESFAKSITSCDSAPPDAEDVVVKVLGMNWNTFTDEIFFNFSDLCSFANTLPLTKRSVLKVTAKIFDPMGFLTPLTIEMKILFQELCINKTNWDSELQGTLLHRWKSFLRELKFIDCYCIPRCYFSQQPLTIQIHGFSDASERAYAAVVYIRSTYNDGRVEIKLVASKSRVAPIKRQTIPRLELLGALILARLVNKLKSIGAEFPTVLWSDSTTALCWIKNERIWKQYIGQRVEEIRRLSPKDLWRHCPGELNPADLPSRGLTAKELSTSTTWWNGPSFLYLPENEWPNISQSEQINEEEILQESVKNEPAVTHSLIITACDKFNPKFDQIIDIGRCSNVTKLLRVTAYVLRFINKLKNRTLEIRKGKIEDITSAELKNAEKLWIKSVQSSAFSDERSFLSQKNLKSTPPVRVVQFGLFLDDDGIIRCNGRITNSTLSASTRTPILLPAKHAFTHLTVKQVHHLVKHSGIRDTLTTLRDRFWVLRGRETVKKIIRHCIVCRRFDAAPCKPPPFADLPSTRVSDDPPFTHVGIDFAGPFYVKENANNDCTKVYVCLLTCASTRAVHLELTRGLGVKDFLLGFRRFASRRGLPATLQSDNAKTFKSSSKEIRKLVRSPEVWRYLTNNQISWNFIVEKAPWWGGYWERLVRSVKSPLKKAIGRSTLMYDELHTLLTEVEGLINARPLTYVYDDEESISYPLTPSDLIYGRRISTTPNCQYYEITSTYESLTKRLKHHRHLLGQFTRQWRNEYLTSLREHATKNAKRDNDNIGVKVGDIVILKNDTVRRSFWKLAKLEELHPGRDGKVRAATVKVTGANGNSIQRLRRPIQHVIPLEVNS